MRFEEAYATSTMIGNFKCIVSARMIAFQELRAAQRTLTTLSWVISRMDPDGSSAPAMAGCWGSTMASCCTPTMANSLRRWEIRAGQGGHTIK